MAGRSILSPFASVWRATGNRVRASLGIGDYWVWAPRLEGELAIAPLVYPLRFDIVIRRDFFQLYASHREAGGRCDDAFVERARSHPYFVWFEHARISVLTPELRHDADEIARRFEARVRASVAIFERIERDGFDARTPIVPETGHEILPAASGRHVAGPHFMGDGCHRLACLMALGHRSLRPEWVRIKCHRRLAPLDVTQLLAPHTEIDWPDALVREAEAAGA